MTAVSGDGAGGSRTGSREPRSEERVGLRAVAAVAVGGAVAVRRAERAAVTVEAAA